MISIIGRILNVSKNCISRKLVDAILYMGQTRIQLELIDYLCKNDTDEALQIVLFDYYMYCYIYQYGKYKYDSWHHKFDSVYLKEMYMRNKYGLEEAIKVKQDFVEPKIENMFKHFCDSLIERDIVTKAELKELLNTISLSTAPPHHNFEGISRRTIISEQGSEGIGRYILIQYANCESFNKFPSTAYYKYYFRQI